jgi:hypothetical protein
VSGRTIRHHPARASATAPPPVRPRRSRALDRLDDLAEPLRAGGLDVVVRREGEAAALPAGIERRPTGSSRRR